jgi:hypothetical protein
MSLGRESYIRLMEFGGRPTIELVCDTFFAYLTNLRTHNSPTKMKSGGEREGRRGTLFCLRARATLRYSHDHLTARCRLSHRIFTQHQLRINSIVHFKIILSGSLQFHTLCLALPYLDPITEPDEVVLDDSVVKGERVEWSSGSCEVTSSAALDCSLHLN